MLRHINYDTKLLAILISSYYFCLPLGRFSIGFFGSDFRLFDFAILLFLLYALSSGLYNRVIWVSKVKAFFTRYLRWLAMLVIFSLIFFILYSKRLEYILPTFIRIYRFTAYLFTGAAVIAIVNTQQKFRFLLYVIMFNIWLQGLIGFIQGLGFIGTLWPEYWNKMYFNMKAPVATLSPHHKHIGVVMLTGFGLTLGLLKYHIRNGLKATLLGLLALLQLSVPLFAGTRTFMLGFFALVLGYLYINKGYTLITLAISLVIGTLSLAYTGDTVTDKISAKYEERVTSRIDKLGYEGLYGERTVIYEQVFKALLNHPYLLITGSGFQNISSFIRANGAHNNFLHVLMELGLGGLFIFLGFLWTTHRNLLRAYQVIPNKFIRTIVSHIWIALIGILATMFVGETIWGQAAMFTLAGQLISIFGLGVAPLFWAVMKRAGHPYAQHSDFI